MSTRLEPMPELLDRLRERAALDGLLGDLRPAASRAQISEKPIKQGALSLAVQ